jgi:hypothetical protein
MGPTANARRAGKEALHAPDGTESKALGDHDWLFTS